MKIKANSLSVKQSFSGDIEVTFNISNEHKHIARLMATDNDLKGDLNVEIKKWSKHRSVDQNSLLWAIETKLAEFYNKSVNEIHKENLISYGVPFGQAVMKCEKAEHYCKTNYARIEKEKIERGVRVALFTIYKGSSEMTTREFSKLVNGILEECKSNNINVEIETKDFKDLIKKLEGRSEKKKN